MFAFFSLYLSLPQHVRLPKEELIIISRFKVMSETSDNINQFQNGAVEILTFSQIPKHTFLPEVPDWNNTGISVVIHIKNKAGTIKRDHFN